VPYRPNQTLAPNCDPGDTDCYVDHSFLRICKGVAEDPSGGSNTEKCNSCDSNWLGSLVYNGGTNGDKKVYI